MTVHLNTKQLPGSAHHHTRTLADRAHLPRDPTVAVERGHYEKREGTRRGGKWNDQSLADFAAMVAALARPATGDSGCFQLVNGG